MIKIAFVILSAVTLMIMGFAAGFPVGQRIGFTTGSEWAMVQAGIIAREEGIHMPVTLESGKFRVILKQPRHLYKTAWKLADRHESKMRQGYHNAEEQVVMMQPHKQNSRF
ncbi:MAG: hypothetical protein WC539_08875 [Nitrospirota bacterium]